MIKSWCCKLKKRSVKFRKRTPSESLIKKSKRLFSRATDKRVASSWSSVSNFSNENLKQKAFASFLLCYACRLAICLLGMLNDQSLTKRAKSKIRNAISKVPNCMPRNPLEIQKTRVTRLSFSKFAKSISEKPLGKSSSKILLNWWKMAENRI